MKTERKPVFQTSIGLGSMVMMEQSSTPSPNASAPTSPSKIQEEQDDESPRPDFHRRSTLVTANGRRKCPEPPLHRKPMLRHSEDDDDEHPLTPPTRTKEVAPRLVEF